MNSLIKIAVILAFAAVASGNLPAVINQVRKAQFQLIQESKASKWPKASGCLADSCPSQDSILEN